METIEDKIMEDKTIENGTTENKTIKNKTTENMVIENKTFDTERALYGSKGVVLKNCNFDGPADGKAH